MGNAFESVHLSNLYNNITASWKPLSPSTTGNRGEVGGEDPEDIWHCLGQQRHCHALRTTQACTHQLQTNSLIWPSSGVSNAEIHCEIFRATLDEPEKGRARSVLITPTAEFPTGHIKPPTEPGRYPTAEPQTIWVIPLDTPENCAFSGARGMRD